MAKKSLTALYLAEIEQKVLARKEILLERHPDSAEAVRAGEEKAELETLAAKITGKAPAAEQVDTSKLEKETKDLQRAVKKLETNVKDLEQALDASRQAEKKALEKANSLASAFATLTEKKE